MSTSPTEMCPPIRSLASFAALLNGTCCGRTPAFWERISPQKCPVEPTPQLPYWIGSPSFDSSISPARSLAAKSLRRDEEDG